VNRAKRDLEATEANKGPSERPGLPALSVLPDFKDHLAQMGRRVAKGHKANRDRMPHIGDVQFFFSD
jgi:hypothetical protein